jgi:hypothetical protein
MSLRACTSHFWHAPNEGFTTLPHVDHTPPWCSTLITDAFAKNSSSNTQFLRYPHVSIVTTEAKTEQNGFSHPFFAYKILKPTAVDSKMTAMIIQQRTTHQSDESIIINSLIDEDTHSLKKRMAQHDTTRLPGLVRIHSDCDSCPYCSDVCTKASCMSCIGKRKLLNGNKQICNQRKTQSAETPIPFRLFSGNRKPDEKETYISSCQLKRHNTKDSAWLLCGEVIYDATDFIKGHPGGEKSILRKSGGAFDCSRDMTFHSPRAIRMWKSKKVGILKPCPGESGIIEYENENVEACVIS